VDVTRTVGWFTTIHPVKLDVSGAAGVGERLRAVKEQVRGVPQGGAGYGLLRWASEDEGVRGRMNELESGEVSFNYLGQLDQVLGEESALSVAEESAGAMRGGENERAYLMEVTASVGGGELQVVWAYGERVHERGTVERLAASYMEELRRIISHCASEGAGGYTPSDFPLASLDQGKLDELLESVEF
jgi:microcystin synthetase protein McyA